MLKPNALCIATAKKGYEKVGAGGRAREIASHGKNWRTQRIEECSKACVINGEEISHERTRGLKKKKPRGKDRWVTWESRGEGLWRRGGRGVKWAEANGVGVRSESSRAKGTNGGRGENISLWSGGKKNEGFGRNENVLAKESSMQRKKKQRRPPSV